MKKVYECDSGKKIELTKILETDPYAEDSFARIGYKLKEGAVIGHDAKKLYIYISAAEDLFKKADEKLKGLVTRCKEDVEKDIITKITKEEEEAESGFGAIFG
ncbi:hypothetical protein HZC08_00975 [Candidatus Micrarchaeota archaeon]|nr:hypothetical protein [Candidatus Micrarchaeota archaeon]